MATVTNLTQGPQTAKSRNNQEQQTYGGSEDRIKRLVKLTAKVGDKKN